MVTIQRGFAGRHIEAVTRITVGLALPGVPGRGAPVAGAGAGSPGPDRARRTGWPGHSCELRARGPALRRARGASPATNSARGSGDVFEDDREWGLLAALAERV